MRYQMVKLTTPVCLQRNFKNSWKCNLAIFAMTTSAVRQYGLRYSTVGYPSDSLASCLIMKHRTMRSLLGQLVSLQCCLTLTSESEHVCVVCTVHFVRVYLYLFKAATHQANQLETTWKPGLRTICELVSNQFPTSPPSGLRPLL